MTSALLFRDRTRGGRQKIDNIICHLRRDCAQLFYVYSGMAGYPGMAPMKFLLKSKLIRRNIVMIRDPMNDDYAQGIGPQLPDLEALLDWHESYGRRLRHVRDIYCLGNSSGGYAAIMFGYLLKAKAVWAFAPRSARPVERNAQAWSNLVELLKEGNGVTEYKILYSANDQYDPMLIEEIKHCPGIKTQQIEPHGKDKHQVLKEMADTGELSDLFPKFVAVTK